MTFENLEPDRRLPGEVEAHIETPMGNRSSTGRRCLLLAVIRII